MISLFCVHQYSIGGLFHIHILSLSHWVHQRQLSARLWCNVMRWAAIVFPEIWSTCSEIPEVLVNITRKDSLGRTGPPPPSKSLCFFTSHGWGVSAFQTILGETLCLVVGLDLEGIAVLLSCSLLILCSFYLCAARENNLHLTGHNYIFTAFKNNRLEFKVVWQTKPKYVNPKGHVTTSQKKAGQHDGVVEMELKQADIRWNS